MNEIRQSEDSDRIELNISDHSDWQLFEKVARSLEQGLKGAWVEKLDGADKRYWDLRVGNEVLTLHLEHYLGISLYIQRPGSNNAASTTLIEHARKLLSAYTSKA